MLPLLLPLALVCAPALARKPPPAPDLDATAATLLGQALGSDEAWTELTFLADRIGHRLSGSPGLEQAVAWGAEEMRKDGLTVTLEPVEVTHWMRGRQHAEVLTPRRQPLPLLTLGGSVATPEGGLTAPVIAVASFAELDRRSDEARGAIVVFDVPFTTYGETVAYRSGGASAAARHGAVAALVRSVTPVSLSTPHTGAMRYADDAPKIPTAAITVEDAAWLRRLDQGGADLTLHLDLQPEVLPPAPSHNVVGELRGRERPDEVVVIGCHLDSWDVGQGAQDDGAGCVTVMQVGALLAALPQPPRRTVRVVLFTNEENGLGGGRAYAAAHENESIVAVLEDDTGAGEPQGFGVDVRPGGARDEAAAVRVSEGLTPMIGLLDSIGAADIGPGFSGADVYQLVEHGALGFGLRHDMSGYWPVHHTDADTLDKIDPMAVRRNVAAATVLTWVLAELPSLPAAD